MKANSTSLSGTSVTCHHAKPNEELPLHDTWRHAALEQMRIMLKRRCLSSASFSRTNASLGLPLPRSTRFTYSELLILAEATTPPQCQSRQNCCPPADLNNIGSDSGTCLHCCCDQRHELKNFNIQQTYSNKRNDEHNARHHDGNSSDHDQISGLNKRLSESASSVVANARL